VEGDDIVQPVEAGRQATPAGAEDAGAMRFVQQQHRIMGSGQLGEIAERRHVAVHRIERFDRNPDPALAPFGAEGGDEVGKALQVIVTGEDRGRLRQADAVMDAGMDQLVRDDQVTALRQGREQRHVGEKAVGQEQRCLGAEKFRGLGLQPFMFGGIAAQQARAARADRHAARDGIGNGLADHRIGREAKIIVGGKITPGARDQVAQAPPRFKRCELRAEGFAAHGRGL